MTFIKKYMVGRAAQGFIRYRFIISTVVATGMMG